MSSWRCKKLQEHLALKKYQHLRLVSAQEFFSCVLSYSLAELQALLSLRSLRPHLAFRLHRSTLYRHLPDYVAQRCRPADRQF